MSGTRRLAGLAEAAVISALAASVWFMAPLRSAVGGETDPVVVSERNAPDEADHQSLEIPSFGVVDPLDGEELGGIAAYKSEKAVVPVPVAPAGQYLQDGSGFDFESRAIHLIGITIEDDTSKREGRWVEGVMIVKVIARSPAARAGLMSRRVALQRVFEGVAVAGCLFFPPAFILVPLVEEAEIGTSYDLIIGVDGERIHDGMELDEVLQKAEPGEAVYLSIMRGRHRLQIPVALPGAPVPMQP